MSERSSRDRWLIGAVFAVGVAIGAWLVMDLREPEPGEGGGGPVTPSRATPEPSGPPASPAPSGPPVPSVRIGESGRLTIEAASIPAGEVFALGLALPDERRGSEPRTVVVVGLDGRRLETTAAPTAGAGTGLRLEFEPGWLRPGRYMIQVETAEKKPLSLERYVLEVR